jgi:hypothetical protein
MVVRFSLIKEGNMRIVLGVVVCALLVPAALLAQYTPTTIYQIQQGAHPTGTDVEVDSVVVTAMDLKPDTYGFNAQEIPGGPWSGILCYSGGTEPYATWDVEVGDLILVQGTYTEYGTPPVSEIGVDNVVMIQKAYGEPDCELLSCGDLGYGPHDSTFAEQWEGVFICVDTVQVVHLGDYEEWTVVEYHDHPGGGILGDSLRIDDKLVDPSLNPPGIGDSLALIKGVYSEEWGNYRLWPRSTEDLVFMGPPPGPNLVLAFATSDTSIYAIFDRDLLESSAENTNNYFLESETPILDATLNLANMKTVRLITPAQPDTLLDSLVVCDVESDEGVAMFECQKYGFMAGLTPIHYVQKPGADTVYWDTPLIEGEQVTVKGVVTSNSSDFGGPFFMRDAAGPWNSVYVYRPGADVSRGDIVTVSGIVDEYYGWTELSSTDYLYVHSSGPLPVADSVANTVLMADSVSVEAYESCFINLDMMEVTAYLDAFGEWEVDDTLATAAVPVGDFAVAEGSGYAYPGLGSIVNIQGCWRYYYQHILEPRDSADIVILVPCPTGVEATDRLATRVDQNAPNPFTSGTTIKFSVPTETRVRVAVYDVTGRRVKDLADQVMTPGEYTVSWDGKDSRNEDVGPGIYFYEFTTPKGSIQKKMVLLK